MAGAGPIRRQDVATAGACGGDPAAERALHRELASAAESGWDFSSRWMAVPGDLATLRTTRVAPADLNAMLAGMEAHMARFAEVSPVGAVTRLDPSRNAKPITLDNLVAIFRDALS